MIFTASVIEPEEVKTVSKKRVSGEKRTVAFLPVIKASFRQANIKTREHDSITSNSLFIGFKCSEKSLLLKQVLINFLYPSHRQDLDPELLIVEPFQIVFRNKDLFKTQFFGLCYPLVDAVYSADLPA